MSAGRLISPALSHCSEWNACHEAAISYRTTIYASLHRPRDEMKWRDFLPVPKKHRRARSGARSEVGTLKGPSDVDLLAPRLTESTPDLRVSTSTLPTSSPLTSRNQEFNGTQTVISPTIHLTVLFAQHRLPLSSWSNHICSWKRPKRRRPPKFPRSCC